jgi:hypothetical protein
MTDNRMQQLVDQAVAQLLRSDDRSRETIEKIARDVTQDADGFTTKYLVSILLRKYGVGLPNDSEDDPVEADEGLNPRVAIVVTSDGDDATSVNSTEVFTTPNTIIDKFQAVDWKGLSSREHDADWLLEPVLPNGRLIALFADGKAGKSLLALDMALALATGRGILNELPGKPRRVMYIDQEMTLDDLEDRVSDLGCDTDVDDLSHLIYYQLQDFAPLDTPEGGEQLCRLVERDEPDLVVFDTVARLVEGSENDADTYRNLYRFTLQPLKAMGKTVLRIDHGGKDTAKGQRGSSAKNDDVDLVWRLKTDIQTSDQRKRDKVSVTLSLERHRIPWVPPKVEMTRTNGHHTLRNPWTVSQAVTDCIRELDKVGAPLDISDRKAKKLLNKHGYLARGTRTRREALSYRKRSAATRPEPPPDVPPTREEHIPTQGGTKEEEHQQEHPSPERQKPGDDGASAFLTNKRNTQGTLSEPRSSLPAPPLGGAEETRDINQAEKNLFDSGLVPPDHDEEQQ